MGDAQEATQHPSRGNRGNRGRGSSHRGRGRRGGSSSSRGGRGSSQRAAATSVSRQTSQEEHLPYGGDANEAMRREDRDAIRAILAAREATKNAADEPVAENDPAQQTKPSRQKKRWWASLTDVDPISLEPLSELEYPPFACGRHHFDGRVLAFYAVSTGTFANPMSREDLTFEDCVRLDQYLKRYKLGEARVADAFKLQQSISSSSQTNGGAASPQVAEQRRHATAVLHSLFGFARYGRAELRDEDPGRAMRAAFEEESEEEDDDEDDDEQQDDEDDDERKEDFPALLGEEDERAQSIAQRHAADWGAAVAGARRQVVTTGGEDFPALPGGDAAAVSGTVPQQAPHFRNAVASYAAASHSARSDSDAARYASIATEVNAAAAADPFPALPRSVQREQYRVLATASMRARPVAVSEDAAAAQRVASLSGLTKRERERLRRRERQKQEAAEKKRGGAEQASVVARIRDVAGEQALATLRKSTMEFRSGVITALALYNTARSVLPREQFDALFEALVGVIPDADAQAELKSTLARQRSTGGTTHPPPPPPARSFTEAQQQQRPIAVAPAAPLPAPPQVARASSSASSASSGVTNFATTAVPMAAVVARGGERASSFAGIANNSQGPRPPRPEDFPSLGGTAPGATTNSTTQPQPQQQQQRAPPQKKTSSQHQSGGKSGGWQTALAKYSSGSGSKTPAPKKTGISIVVPRKKPPPPGSAS